MYLTIITLYSLRIKQCKDDVIASVPTLSKHFKMKKNVDVVDGVMAIPFVLEDAQ